MAVSIRNYAVGLVVLAAAALGAENRFQAYTDGASYNAGPKVRLKIAGLVSEKLTAAVLYGGDARPLANEIQLSGAGSEYQDVWTIPPDSGEAAARGQEATWYYQSQDGNHFQGALQTFDQLPREEVHWQILDWPEHEGWNENR